MTARRLALVGAAAATLLLAGVAGAVVKLTIFTLPDGRYARLSGTDVFCQNTRNTAGRRIMACAVFVPVANANRTRRLRGWYGFVISELGISVYRATGPTSQEFRRYFSHP